MHSAQQTFPDIRLPSIGRLSGHAEFLLLLVFPNRRWRWWSSLWGWMGERERASWCICHWGWMGRSSAGLRSFWLWPACHIFYPHDKKCQDALNKKACEAFDFDLLARHCSDPCIFIYPHSTHYKEWMQRCIKQGSLGAVSFGPRLATHIKHKIAKRKRTHDVCFQNYKTKRLQELFTCSSFQRQIMCARVYPKSEMFMCP